MVEAIQKMDIKQLHNLKDRMKAVANANYTWKIIAQKYEHLIMGFDFEYAKKPLLPKFSNINSKYLAQEGIAHLKHTQFFYENR